MSENIKPRVLIVGCGLIGTSLALAWQRADVAAQIDGMETNEHHIQVANAKNVFQSIYRRLPDAKYDLVVLAVPTDIACDLLPIVASLATIVMDVCSVKAPVCIAAETVCQQGQFAPTHPMAGLAVGGPEFATADLFIHRPWILLTDYSANHHVQPYIAATGARLEWVQSARQHDDAMAAVSHCVHLTSLSVMTAYANAMVDAKTVYHHLTGPGFRDVTRLSQSPPDFWVSTLLDNQVAVVAQIDRVIDALSGFRSALQAGQGTKLRDRLEESRYFYSEWKEAQPE